MSTKYFIDNLSSRHLRVSLFRFKDSDGETAPNNQLLDAYVSVDCDEYHIGQTITKPKTATPIWNENYQVSTFSF